MYMCIVIVMNIYITKSNEENLRQLSDYTMSGLVNYLLENYFKTHSKADIKEVNDSINAVVEHAPKSMLSSFPSDLDKKDVKFCKHDAVKGFCKKGCK